MTEPTHEVNVAQVMLVGTLFLSSCASFDLEWQKTRPAALQPWRTVIVQDAEAACKAAGATAYDQGRLLACATWSPSGCTIYLPEAAPSWIIEHEKKHCEGYTH